MNKAIALFKEETDVIFPAFHDENLFQGPWKKKQFEDWTPEICINESEVLTKARDVEAKGMEVLEEFIKT